MGEENSEAILLISSLISASHSIKVFSAKWQSIRHKLEELFSNLAAIHNWESALPAVSHSILATLNHCHQLAKQCLDLSYSGKLLMQSDLDIVSAKIDAHINNIFDVYAAGLLTRTDAIVVSRPTAAASRDDVRFYVVDLLSRFKIGSTDMKKQALLAFNQVIQEDERYITVALRLDNFVGFLVNFLDFKDGEIQQEAAKCVCLIAGSESWKSALIGAGAIAPLIRVVESGNEASKELAATCLLLLTENSDNAWLVSAHGGVTALLKICGGGDGGELVALACAVLKNLVGVEEIKRFVVEEGGIPQFVNLAKSKDEMIKIRSVDLLQTMACNDESIKEMIIEEGGVRALVRALSPKWSLATKTREMALRGIVNICCSSETSLHLLVNYGFMDHILYFLRHGEASVQELSLKTAFWLSGTSEEGRKAMGEAGFMPVLVRFLDSKSIETREMAAETISSMIVLPKNRKKFVHSDQNLGLLLRMLEVNNSGNKKLLLSILMSLTATSATARKKIATSAYLKHIEKLAEAQVPDAKKILRKISSNRLGSFLNGIWHS
ncbi:vacuolar protein 8-like [Salvia miltiorrhiza]|uniref:vacuolar protein 8-like n=1 Tax=Salvia miltiorrhiza TaxID=226208 RepID=UPI0025ACD168|nr:vacuolar protein 8-like [Salvia miltiorrhiza]